MEDPVAIGMRLHTDLMRRIAQYVPSREELSLIGRMIDCFVGSAQVHAVEKGLDGTPEQYREYIRARLESFVVPTPPRDANAGAARPAVDGAHAPAPAPAPECLCEKDADGECPRCKGTISKTISDVAGFIDRTIVEFQAVTKDFMSSRCTGCGSRYLDWAIAQASRKLLGSFGSKELAEVVLSKILEILPQYGVREAPLTKKAWMDLCAEKHWS